MVTEHMSTEEREKFEDDLSRPAPGMLSAMSRSSKRRASLPEVGDQSDPDAEMTAFEEQIGYEALQALGSISGGMVRS